MKLIDWRRRILSGCSGDMILKRSYRSSTSLSWFYCVNNPVGCLRTNASHLTWRCTVFQIFQGRIQRVPPLNEENRWEHEKESQKSVTYTHSRPDIRKSQPDYCGKRTEHYVIKLLLRCGERQWRTRIANRIPPEQKTNTPFQTIFKNKPDSSHVRVYGCKTFVHILDVKKKQQDPKSLFHGWQIRDEKSKGKEADGRDALANQNLLWHISRWCAPTPSSYGSRVSLSQEELFIPDSTFGLTRALTMSNSPTPSSSSTVISFFLGRRGWGVVSKRILIFPFNNQSASQRGRTRGFRRIRLFLFSYKIIKFDKHVVQIVRQFKSSRLRQFATLYFL